MHAHVHVHVLLSVPVSVSVSVSVSDSFSASVPVSISVFVSVSVSVAVLLLLSLPVSVSASLRLCLCLCRWLCVSVYHDERGPELIDHMMRQRRGSVSGKIVENMLVTTIRTMVSLCRDELYELRDWHLANVAFREKDSVSLVLIDWTNNAPADGPIHKHHMTKAFKSFAKSITWDLDRAFVTDEWKVLAEAFKAVCDSWWSSLHYLPSDADVQYVVDQLSEVTSVHCDVLEAPTASFISEVTRRAVPTPPRPSTHAPSQDPAAGSTPVARPELSRRASTVPADSEVDRRAVSAPSQPSTPRPSRRPVTHPSLVTPPSISVVTPPSSHRAHDGGAPALTPSVNWPYTDPPTSEADRADAQSAQAIIAALTKPDNFGRRAATSFCAAALGHLQHMRSTYRHGKPSANSIPLSVRLEDGNHRQLVYDRDEGDDIGFLFLLIIEFITERGFVDRCGGKPPKAATDPLKFHALFGAKFVNMCGAPFHTMNAKQRYDRLYAFLKQKWSTDKKRKGMRPATDAGWCRCEASWGEFFIDEEELCAICEEAVAAYASHRHP